ncbi:uncharacterized membrane protein YkvA (DUF1232 family)/plasmid maintenance system antidote protein VapI [Cytobacillus purgationiresistens]|uniref:Uncharacterized membrane protein YkvA (DUF1232 family)/plasmid maintenance system antidote protein VapI n=1 Tax=Cytobacillus purgationiresistens TaxID=863449 RepID=A0ABU0ABY0_9BACI|nr:uncharacterized membrane protein YkvA (DUF1232 family)/plasmid maintenance system antidote protein VapI [Cytobacillus purgationiresistens]
MGSKLKSYLLERSLSLRTLSEMSNIDSATLSRIINGKRRATPAHIQKIAQVLQISNAEMYIAAGYEIEHQPSTLEAAIEEIQEELKFVKAYNKDFTTNDIETHLQQYEQYAQTDEGKETVSNHFKAKLKKLGSIGPFITDLENMYQKFNHKQGTPHQIVMMGAALIYFITAVDCIPDYIFPIGYIDDAIAIKLVVNGLK